MARYILRGNIYRSTTTQQTGPADPRKLNAVVGSIRRTLPPVRVRSHLDRMNGACDGCAIRPLLSQNVGGPDAWNRSGQIAVGRSHAGHITRHEYPEVFAPQADDRTRLEQGCDLDFMILLRGRVAAILAALPRGRLDSNPPNTLFI